MREGAARGRRRRNRSPLDPVSGEMARAGAKAYLEPTQEAGRAFFGQGIVGPVVMLNLLRFRAVADYSATPALAPDAPISGERPTGDTWSTRCRTLERSGGEVLFFGEGSRFLIGPDEERWDAAMLVRQASAESVPGLRLRPGLPVGPGPSPGGARGLPPAPPARGPDRCPGLTLRSNREPAARRTVDRAAP